GPHSLQGVQATATEPTQDQHKILEKHSCCRVVHICLNQENATNEEILLSLEHVRPGKGYKPNFTMFEKCEVNGKDAHPLFTFLKEALPFPHDDPSALMTNPQYIIWSPVRRNDISWNFEKFLIAPDGVPFKRYSRHFETIKIQDDIELLLQKVPKDALE
uniref:Glutathione peroxidase 1 n=1 Tax=Anser cygnoides TaxID=8845 RepID=A0A8B9EJY3_ANSCY